MPVEKWSKALLMNRRHDILVDQLEYRTMVGDIRRRHYDQIQVGHDVDGLAVHS